MRVNYDGCLDGSHLGLKLRNLPHASEVWKLIPDGEVETQLLCESSIKRLKVSVELVQGLPVSGAPAIPGLASLRLQVNRLQSVSQAAARDDAVQLSRAPVQR